MRLIATVVVLLTSLLSYGQQSIRVVVQDETGKTIPGISVRSVEKNSQVPNSTLSDENGIAEFAVSSWPVTISIDDIGYQGVSRTFSRQPASTVTLTTREQRNGINEVIVTGVGRPTRLDEAVANYRIISSQDMKGMGAVTLADALRNQLGVTVSQDASLGSQLSMRGLSGNNIKILVDGLPVNGREGSNVDISQLNLANIERIEIVQGPMNVMYGSDGIGGVYNLITKTNKKSESIGATAYYESIGKYNLNIDAAKSWEKHNLSVVGTRNFFQGWDPNNKDARNPLWSPKEQYIGNLKYIYRINDFASLTYGMDLTAEELTIKGAIPEPYTAENRTTSDAYFNTRRWANRLQLKWRTGANGYWESNNSYAKYHRKRTTYQTDLSTLQRELSTIDGDQSVVAFDNVTSRTTYNNKAGRLNYTFGYDANLEFASGVEKIREGKKFIGDYALFLTTDIKIWDELTLQPAVRFIHNTAYNAPVSPSLSALYKPNAKLQFRGSYSRGFRAPTLKELYLNFFDFNHAIIGNEDLKAEYSNQFQAAIAYTAYEKGKRSFITSVTGFYDNVKNQIALGGTTPEQMAEYGRSDLYIYTNIGHVRMLTLQWNNELNIDNLLLKGGLQFTNSFETISENYTTLGFHYWEANASGRYSVPKYKAGISVFYKYTGPQPQVGSIEGNGIFSENNLREFQVFDASVDKSFWNDRVQLTVGVRNLFNAANIGFVGSNTGATGGGHSSNGLLLSTGRSIFGTLRFQLNR